MFVGDNLRGVISSTMENFHESLQKKLKFMVSPVTTTPLAASGAATIKMENFNPQQPLTATMASQQSNVQHQQQLIQQQLLLKLQQQKQLQQAQQIQAQQQQLMQQNLQHNTQQNTTLQSPIDLT